MQKHSMKFHKEPGQFECAICPRIFPNKRLLQVNYDFIELKSRSQIKNSKCISRSILPLPLVNQPISHVQFAKKDSYCNAI